jgi:hypothetical protein
MIWKKEKMWTKLSTSSSFIKPPANGHHRWSGAGKATFYNLYNFFKQNIIILARIIYESVKRETSKIDEEKKK